MRIEPTRSPASDLTPVCVVVEVQRTADHGLRFGEWLVRRGLISPADLFRALLDAERAAARVGDMLVTGGVLPRPRVEEEARAFDTFRAFHRA